MIGGGGGVWGVVFATCSARFFRRRLVAAEAVTGVGASDARGGESAPSETIRPPAGRGISPPVGGESPSDDELSRGGVSSSGEISGGGSSTRASPRAGG